ncbi:MAG: NFACT family protein [Pyrinomonadaceae bacterium]|nr:NFACT family protein [Pyrinomonadaceae bacterium]MCX7639830.1 NFACT family protein [Pyrinomonadaceae bacterium]MDW8304002.1 NFACT family protein [Acidobacteriota bacterium]
MESKNPFNDATVEALAEEFEKFLNGKTLGKIFQLSSFSFAFDFLLPYGLYLFVSVEPNFPRVYLIRRKLRELKEVTPSNFLLFVRKRLSGAILESISKLKQDRVLELGFIKRDESEGLKKYFLIIQLTGRSANLFLADENKIILKSLRQNHGEGQVVGSKFSPPERQSQDKSGLFDKGDFGTLSEALDVYCKRLESERAFQSKAKKAKGIVRRSLERCELKREKLLSELKEAEKASLWKKYGDLILANLNDIVRLGRKLLLVDYFDERLPTIELEVDEELSLVEAAEFFFKKYAKAKRAVEKINNQLEDLSSEIQELKHKQLQLEKAIEEGDEEFLDRFLGTSERALESKPVNDSCLKYARRFLSSDGMEILVGRGAKENDYLTFRIAKSLDFWFHAADYPGSHVVVRNPRRFESLPQKTLIEAAEIAAFYSQARGQPKVAVNYTQKKFVNKPKSAPHGLVSLSKFKTILVEPKVSLQNLS